MDSTKPKRESWADSAEEEEAEQKEAELKAAAAAAAAEVAAKEAEDDEDAPPGLTPRSAAKNAEFGESPEKAAAELESLKVSEGVVDQPDPSIKTGELNDVPDGSEHEIKKVVAAETPYSSAKTFEELNLSEPLLRGLYSEMKFERPSKIQAVTLPMILLPPNANLIAQAHNGSGKTTCFVLGMLSRVNPQLKTPQALCICPTRELAQQNEAVLLRMAKYTGITCACTASEGTGTIVSSSEQTRLGDQVVIGTPGTLKRWMTKDRILPVKNIKILVFDEADHMLDQDGFQDDSIRMIQFITKSNPTCQILLFSATFNERVKRFAQRVVPSANQVYVPKEQLSLDVIKQYRVRVPSRDAKVVVLKDKIFPAAEKLGQSIIFVKTRETARDLHRRLEADGHRCTSIQGGMSHEERDDVIREYRSGTTKILIATDVLARGFDQAQVTLVVNFDLPVKNAPPNEPEYETYLHRIGRSGRFGRKGAAFNLVCGERDERTLNKIEKHFDRVIPDVQWDDDDAFEKVLKEAGLA
ncbi:hypothetical protein CLOM_g10878 [Closterium sp. NIES-68]|nr:hypothetical protein CLOM_g10878 [Closterium sp. NIES-68]GJP74840.1 hypothetical protein CLOP_g5370 [Closterium sp. NIES-67]